MSQAVVLDALPWQAWKNGAGRTREIAVEPPGTGSGDFDWRLSVAEVAADAPFSVFPGVDRCIVLLRGRGMALRGADGGLAHRVATPGEPVHFRGEEVLRAELIEGTCQDLNVMTRRGRWRSELQCLSAPARIAAADVSCVLALEGAPMLAGEALAPGEARLQRDTHADLPLTGTGRVLAVRLLREATR